MRKTVIIAVIFAMAAGVVFAHDLIDNRWVWRNDFGALRYLPGNMDIYILDTYEDQTISREATVQYTDNEKAAAKKLTDQGLDLWKRLRNHPDIDAVMVSVRFYGLRKYPLSDWDDILPQIQQILDNLPETK